MPAAPVTAVDRWDGGLEVEAAVTWVGDGASPHLERFVVVDARGKVDRARRLVEALVVEHRGTRARQRRDEEQTKQRPGVHRAAMQRFIVVVKRDQDS